MACPGFYSLALEWRRCERPRTGIWEGRCVVSSLFFPHHQLWSLEVTVESLYLLTQKKENPFII
jgi:hypothetical protein